MNCSRVTPCKTDELNSINADVALIERTLKMLLLRNIIQIFMFGC